MRPRRKAGHMTASDQASRYKTVASRGPSTHETLPGRSPRHAFGKSPAIDRGRRGQWIALTGASQRLDDLSIGEDDSLDRAASIPPITGRPSHRRRWTRATLDRRPERRVSFSLQPVQKIAALSSTVRGRGRPLLRHGTDFDAGRSRTFTPGPFGRPVTSYGPSTRVADLPCGRSRGSAPLSVQ